MIKLRDHTDRLHRLHHLGASEEEIVAEFDRICEAVFGATPDDVSDDDWNRLYWDQDASDHEMLLPWFPSVDYRLDQGIDPRISSNHPVRYWEDFARMARAKELGMLPKTPEERAQRRLEAEAREFQRSRGIIRG
jgi:hypothetical protein